MNIEELEQVLTESAISVNVHKNNLCSLDVGWYKTEEAREEHFDNLLDLIHRHYLHGRIDGETYRKLRAQYLFERDGTVVRYDF
jgi:hypothetical protein